MGKQLLSERVSAPFSGVRVTGTNDAPIIEGVLLCGATSVNRRRYLKSAFEGGRVKRYNSVPVKITRRHGEANGLYEEQIGVVRNARLNSAGLPIGDIAINPSTELARKFVWDARNEPKACGMSHVAQCDTRKAKDGWDEVTEIVEAVSVDVIGANHAATTKGLYEHVMTKTTEAVGDGSSNQNNQIIAMWAKDPEGESHMERHAASPRASRRKARRKSKKKS